MDSTTQTVSQQELRQFIEQIERLSAEKADLADGIKEVYAELKGRGYEPAIVRKVVAIRKRDANDVAEEEAILDLYLSAMGL